MTTLFDAVVLRVPIWKINFCSKVLQPSGLPRCREKPQTAICCFLIPTVSTSANLFLFSRHYIPTNSVAPFSTYQQTHTNHNSSIRSNEGQTLETSASKLFTVANLRYQLSCYTLPPTQHHSFCRNLPTL